MDAFCSTDQPSSDRGSAYHKEKSQSLKVILLGDSAVGKSKLVERYLLDDFQSIRQSTFGVNIYNKTITVDGQETIVEIWDTAGQERFNNVHAAYFHHALCCIMVFDVTRKVTYKNMDRWYEALKAHAPETPAIVVANKIDTDISVTEKSFAFADRNNLELFYVSASDGTNVVRIFERAVELAQQFKISNKETYEGQVMDILQKT